MMSPAHVMNRGLLTPYTGAVSADDAQCTGVAIRGVGDDPLQYARQDRQHHKLPHRADEEGDVGEAVARQHVEVVVRVLAECQRRHRWVQCRLRYLVSLQLLLARFDLG